MNYLKENYIKILLSIILFVIPIFTKAAITYPYTVDEKPQVIFGDSAQVETYLGLENYTQDYIDGYAHFTFTYTHDICCFASFPPLVYLTNVDPRTTISPIERSSFPAFDLHSFSIPTDWYFYDIQFDANGYRVSVKEQATSTEIYNEYIDYVGQQDTDWVALANRYPIFDSVIEYSMSFTPVPIKEPSQTIDPVIIIPGIMGSTYKNGELVIDPILHTYDDLIATLVANGYVEGENLFTFPYEWRDSNVLSAAILRNKINEIQEICDCNKVDLVAHSMGGLVARQYIQSNNYGNDVDQVIFLGVPHKGSQKSYLQWEAGEFSPDINIIDMLTKSFFTLEALKNGHSNIFNYIHNKPITSVQELLPTFDYLKDKDTGLIRDYPNNYPQNTFLENLNNNISKLLNSGVKINNIVSNSGSDTIDKIRVKTSTKPGLWTHGEPEGFYTISADNGLEKSSGDGSVTIFGAALDNSIDNINSTSSHNRIPTIEENRIYKILTGEDSTTNIDSGFQISPIVLLLQLQSPIDFVITAPDGKRVGKNFDTGGEFNEIKDAFYSGYQTEEEYITILNPLDGEYKVKLQGTGSGGEYGVLTSYISEDFATTTQTTGITAPNQITNLNVEVDNDNPTNIEQEREVTLDIILSDINVAYNIGWIKDKKVQDSLIKQAKAIIKFEKKRSGKFEAKVDKILLKLLEKELDLLLKKGKINNEAYKLLKTDLEYLLINN